MTHGAFDIPQNKTNKQNGFCNFLELLDSGEICHLHSVMDIFNKIKYLYYFFQQFLSAPCMSKILPRYRGKYLEGMLLWDSFF